MIVCPVYRVHWLKAKSRRDRCKEEVAILGREMDSVWLGYLAKAHTWKERAQIAAKMVPTTAVRGMQSYAKAREKLWLGMADDARASFESLGLVLLPL